MKRLGLVVLVLSLLSCSTNGATQTALTPVSGNALYDTTAFFTDGERDDFADWCRTNTKHYYGIDCLRLADGIKEIVNLSGYEKTCVGDNIRKVVLMYPVAEEDEPQLLTELESCGPGVTHPDVP